MDVRNSQAWRGWIGAVALSLLLTSCFVNPVPTPATVGGTTTDSLPGSQDTADTLANKDAAAADTADGAAPSVALATFSATATDSAIADGVHAFAVAADALSTGKLVVLLPDANVLPSQYLSLAAAIAQQGHRVLVLATPVAAQAACADDGTCLELARQELLDGQDRTPKVTVTTPNSLQNRLVKALTWLDKNRPGENWGKFYVGSTPLWSDIAIAGHGEGASQAAMVAMHQIVWRAVMLGGPTDAAGAQPASWLAGTPQTPSTAWRTLAHTKDPAWAIIAAAWTSLGLGSSAAVFSLDSAQQPGISVQMLTTAANVPDPHAAIAVDGALPADATAAQHVRAGWKLLFLPY